MRHDRLGIVQFIHPGKEHPGHRGGGLCEWGLVTSPHSRKFMMERVDYVADGDARHSGLSGFWGEWEAPSFAQPLKCGGDDEPQYVHFAAYREPTAHAGLWDTDPFVFGRQGFLYNGCQQHVGHHRAAGPSETFLRRLARGSLILFGSSVARRFVLDTVLVVGEYEDYPNGDYSAVRRRVPDEYVHMSLHTQALIEPRVKSFRLYFGQTPGTNGQPYSFTPCRPAVPWLVPFARPQVHLPGVTNSRLTQGKKFTECSAGDVTAAWRAVVSQVRAAGLALAHHVDLAPRRL